MIAFNTVVRPVLEYASQVWPPYIKTLIDKVETVQRRAIKWAYRLGPVHNLSPSMLVKDMQAEEGSKGTEDHSVHISPIDKSTNKQANRIEGAAVKEALHNGNGIQDIGDESSDKLSSDSKSHGSPAAEQEMTSMQSHDMAQPLNFELDSEAQSDVSGRNFWQLPHHEDGNMFRFQSINPPQSMPNYGLNNNNSFPQPVHFGSIGQPTNYMPNHGHFSSPPGMHNMSMMSNMGPMGGMNYPNSHSQNQRRA
ncbi:hypothetical protein EB796_002080 [Bugula neritina]|uniref:Uncharacterized protein n=1 Tax=Bugula neritina TaxID=10212 RepID=A0A7J7KN63_BUGNE|nr:hypothetical protein EB796_002080 [Bugula neritina]